MKPWRGIIIVSLAGPSSDVPQVMEVKLEDEPDIFKWSTTTCAQQRGWDELRRKLKGHRRERYPVLEHRGRAHNNNMLATWNDPSGFYPYFRIFSRFPSWQVCCLVPHGGQVAARVGGAGADAGVSQAQPGPVCGQLCYCKLCSSQVPATQVRGHP